MTMTNVLLVGLSPDTAQTLTSTVATILGIALVFNRGMIRFLVRCYLEVYGRLHRVSGTSGPQSQSWRAMFAKDPRG